MESQNDLLHTNVQEMTKKRMSFGSPTRSSPRNKQAPVSMDTASEDSSNESLMKVITFLRREKQICTTELEVCFYFSFNVKYLDQSKILKKKISFNLTRVVYIYLSCIEYLLLDSYNSTFTKLMQLNITS